MKVSMVRVISLIVAMTLINGLPAEPTVTDAAGSHTLADPQASVAWTADIRGGADPLGAVLTSPAGIIYSNCGGANWAARGYSPAGAQLGTLPIDSQTPVHGCADFRQGPTVDEAGNLYVTTGGSPASSGWPNHLTSYTPQMALRWSVPLPPLCAWAPEAYIPQSLMIGADGDLYLLQRPPGNACNVDDVHLIGVDTTTGTIKVNVSVGGLSTPRRTGHMAALPYAGGLIVRLRNQITYYDYRGHAQPGRSYAVSDHQYDDGLSIATVDGRIVTGTAVYQFATNDCPINYNTTGVESYGPGGRLWRTVFTDCRSLVSLNVTASGGAVALYTVYGPGGSETLVLTGFSPSGAKSWEQVLEGSYYYNVVAGIDAAGHVVLRHTFGVSGAEPWQRYGVVQLAVYDAATGALQSTVDTRALPPGPLGPYSIDPMSMTVGLSEDRLTVGLSLCESAGGCIDATALTLYSFAVPGIGLDYPRGVLYNTPVTEPDHLYVALGDSYAAGEGLGPFDPATNVESGDTKNTCRRSTSGAFATQATDGTFLVRPGVPAIGRAFWACSGATTATMQLDVGQLPPSDGRYQFNQPRQVPNVVGEATRWISISAGGNDVEFGKLGEACALAVSAGPLAPDFLRVPGAQPCDTQLAASRAKMQPPGSSQLDQSLRSVYRQLLDAAPQAKVAIVGYPRIFPEDMSGGAPLRLSAAQKISAGLPASAMRLCRTNGLFPNGYWLGASDVHASRLSAFIQELNQTALRQVVALAAEGYGSRITFANTWDTAVPHTCTGNTDDVSVNGVLLSAGNGGNFLDLLSTATFHPTRIGQTRMGNAVEAAFQGGISSLADTVTINAVVGQTLPEVPILFAGGTGTISVTTGFDPVPAWLTLAAGTGQASLGGVPTAAGSYQVLLSLQDAHGHHLAITVRLEVSLTADSRRPEVVTSPIPRRRS